MTSSLLFTGQIKNSNGVPASGVGLHLVDPKSDNVIAMALTGGDGNWLAKFNGETEPKILAEFSGELIELHVVGQDGKSVHKTSARAKPGKVSQHNIKLSQDSTRKLTPLFPLADRDTGSPMQEDQLEFIDQAISIMIGKEGPELRRYMNAARCPLPPLVGFRNILDDAWGALDSDFAAERRFRKSLSVISSAVEQKLPGAVIDHGIAVLEKLGINAEVFDKIRNSAGEIGGRPGRKAALGSLPSFAAATIRSAAAPDQFTPLPDGPVPAHPCVFPAHRSVPLYVSAFRIARDFKDAALLVGGLEHGLCGAGATNEILEAAYLGMETGNFDKFGGLLGFQAGECGPDDGPVPNWPEPRPRPCTELPTRDDLCNLERMACLADMARQARRLLQARNSRYRIESIEPRDACPGSTIVIRGNNFGEVAGLVCFGSSLLPESAVCTRAASWGNTEIEVTVPEAARAGEIFLKIIEDRVEVCGRIHEIYRSGDGSEFTSFTGGLPSISHLTVNGRSTNAEIEPNSTATVSWNAGRGRTNTSVDIRIMDGSTEVLRESNLQSFGMIEVAIPNFPTERNLTLICKATNHCGTVDSILEFFVTVVPAIEVIDMEVTQGIQRFWRSGVVWNSLPTISQKDTIVRAYISCDRNGFMNDQARVTGRLVVGGTILTPINGITPTSGSGNPFITARPRTEIVRSTTNHTLNFRIPAGLSTGTQSLRLEVWTELEYYGERPQDQLTASRTWTNETPLPVRFVRIRDNRSGGTGQIPTSAECRFTIQRAFDLLPSPPTNIAPAWRATWNTTRQFNMSDTGPLEDLLDDLDDEHNCDAWEWLWDWTGTTDCPDPDNAYWVGLTRPFNRGIGYRPGNTCISAIYRNSDGQNDILRIKTAHELGHNLSFRHVNRGGGVGGPFYPHPNNGNLQDVPFDPYWNIAVSGSVQDFMSYGARRWASGDSWQRLQGQI